MSETKELTVAQHSGDPLAWTRRDRGEMLRVLKSSLYPGASDESALAVMEYCAAAGLNVMLKPVHIVPMWIPKKEVERDGRKVVVDGTGMMRDVIMPGIGHYRVQASRTGRYLGLSAPEWGPVKMFDLNGVKVEAPEWCRMTAKVLVDGHVCEFTAEEYWIENYATAGKDTTAPNAMWRKRPRGQLAKVTEAQALRKAFPELGAETAEEMEGKTLYIDEPVVAETRNVKPSASAAAALDEVSRRGRVQDQRGAASDEREAEARSGGADNAPDASSLPTDDDGEVPKMPGDASNAWEVEGKWSKGWKWLNEVMPTVGPQSRQALAEEHAALLHAVRGASAAYKKAAEEFVSKMQVKVPDVEPVEND